MFPLVPFLSYVFVTTFTPGPNNIMSMTNANQFGFKKTQKFILGVSAGFLVIMLLCSYFSLVLYSVVPKIKTVMSIIGAVYMLYLAYKIVSSKPHNGEKRDEKLNTFLSGMLLQFINIKVILYGITVIANFIIPYYKSHTSLMLFSLLLAFIGFMATSCWAAFGVFFQRVLSKYERLFNALMGLLLVYSAVSLFI
ncbi:MAG: LysE family transporter [Christensenellales bacterium]|jgi:cysteine/O-acetylserine efflux protein